MKRLSMSGLLILLVSIFAFGQDSLTDKHPIDIKLEQCLAIDSNQTTSRMIICINIAKDEWDIELNKNYRLLMDTLSPNAKESLRLSQRQWLQYRDKEFSFIATFYYKEMQGTIWKVVAAQRKMDIIKQRVMDLKSDYNELISY